MFTPLHLSLANTIRLSFHILLLPRLPRPPLFPYTTLFRSVPVHSVGALRVATAGAGGPDHGVVPGDHLGDLGDRRARRRGDRKSTRLNSSHVAISYAVFCLKKKKYKNKSDNNHYIV